MTLGLAVSSAIMLSIAFFIVIHNVTVLSVIMLNVILLGIVASPRKNLSVVYTCVHAVYFVTIAIGSDLKKLGILILKLILWVVWSLCYYKLLWKFTARSFCKRSLLSTWHFISLSFHLNQSFSNLFSHNSYNSKTLSFLQPNFLSDCHFTILLFCQHVI